MLNPEAVSIRTRWTDPTDILSSADYFHRLLRKEAGYSASTSSNLLGRRPKASTPRTALSPAGIMTSPQSESPATSWPHISACASIFGPGGYSVLRQGPPQPMLILVPCFESRCFRDRIFTLSLRGGLGRHTKAPGVDVPHGCYYQRTVL